jgi:hypothetical protein
MLRFARPARVPAPSPAAGARIGERSMFFQRKHTCTLCAKGPGCKGGGKADSSPAWSSIDLHHRCWQSAPSGEGSGGRTAGPAIPSLWRSSAARSTGSTRPRLATVPPAASRPPSSRALCP